MSHVPNDEENSRAFTLGLLLVVLFGILLFSIPARADAVVFICPATPPCTETTARIVFIVPTDSPIPTACLTAAMSKAAEVSDLKGNDETLRIVCKR